MTERVSVRPVTVPEFRAAKARAERLVVVTAYDFPSAQLADAAEVDAILVGDSLGTVVQGHANTIPVTLGQMAYHTEMVARATRRALVIADLPFGSYQESSRQAVRSAIRLLKAGAAAVKIEGGARMAATLAALVRADIPVMGHVGLTPQSVHQMGGFKVQRAQETILADAQAVTDAGAFALVIEGVPATIGQAVTAAIPVPTIGIGAGPDCDGQVLVWHDLLGLFDAFRPKFVKQYANLGDLTREALQQFRDEVREGRFPGPEHSFK
ncbi:MAG: 3-methyl-2-oxobutanoate hydroxymethyltransferase [Bacteroidales bacterium]|nr:3-methyl-2-oxobutanoate hydroxymethyltransferase [Bacteroidales bacterium]